jgi:hypothetical protein
MALCDPRAHRRPPDEQLIAAMVERAGAAAVAIAAQWMRGG